MGDDFFPEGGENGPKIVILPPKNGPTGGDTFVFLGEG